MDEGLPSSVDATPEEVNAAVRALRELGVEQLPRDVAVRLERRLDEELGPSPPVRRPVRKPWLRPIAVLVPLAAAALIAVAVVVSTNGGGSKPTAASSPTPPANGSATPPPSAGAASGTSDEKPLPRAAIEAPFDASVAHSVTAVADASKAAALRARAQVCKTHPSKRGCPKPHAGTSTTP
jgi:hypothetical protein